MKTTSLVVTDRKGWAIKIPPLPVMWPQQSHPPGLRGGRGGGLEKHNLQMLSTCQFRQQSVYEGNRTGVEVLARLEANLYSIERPP